MLVFFLYVCVYLFWVEHHNPTSKHNDVRPYPVCYMSRRGVIFGVEAQVQLCQCRRALASLAIRPPVS
jgi:hypothetical protein